MTTPTAAFDETLDDEEVYTVNSETDPVASCKPPPTPKFRAPVRQSSKLRKPRNVHTNFHETDSELERQYDLTPLGQSQYADATPRYSIDPWEASNRARGVEKREANRIRR